jgi:FAD/FMN-containing dehydrogenase
MYRVNALVVLDVNSVRILSLLSSLPPHSDPSHSADHPISTHSHWSSGTSCPPTSSSPNSTACTQGGFPVYVIDARTTRHIQLAINFARNANIRLVVKNSGHDFNGKSVGGYSLSVWVHNLRAMTYNAADEKHGGARTVSYAAGSTAADGNALMRSVDMTMLVAGGTTVGIAGGFLQGGGHSTFTSYYGLAADQVLGLTAVTADGRVVEMNDKLNTDLFWAFRGGGGGESERAKGGRWQC